MRRLALLALLAAACDTQQPQPDSLTRYDLVFVWDFTVPDEAEPEPEDYAVPPPDLLPPQDRTGVVEDLVPGPEDLVKPKDLTKLDRAVGDPPDLTGAAQGKCAPTLDGSLDDAEWAAAWSAANSKATNWGPGVNELKSLRVCYDKTNLYLGVEGIAEKLNTLAVFIDRDDGKATGLMAPSEMKDTMGAIDKSITAAGDTGKPTPWKSWPAGFGADLVWASMGMTSADGVPTDGAGLRDIVTKPTDYLWLKDQVTVCSSAKKACEVGIPWTTIYGGPRPGTVKYAVFARLLSGDGTAMSNQTVPEDDPASPGAVTKLLKFIVP